MPYPLQTPPSYYTGFDWTSPGQKRNGVFYPGDPIKLLHPLPNATWVGLQHYADFEGGTLGGTIGTSRLEESPLTGRFVSVSGSPLYDNAHVAHGAQSAKMDGTTGCNLSWPTNGGDYYGRFYFYATANPTALANICAALNLVIRVDTSGSLNIVAAGVLSKPFTNKILLNAWNRIEFHFAHNNSGTGAIDVKLFAGDSTTPTEEQSITGINSGNVPVSIAFGGIAATLTGPYGSPYWFDDMAINLSAFPGPYAHEIPTLETFSYTVTDNFTGNIVSSGTYQGEYFTPIAPPGGWLFGSYRVGVTGSQTDPNYGPSYGQTNITIRNSSVHFPPLPVTSTVPDTFGNGEAPDFPMFGAMGLGTSRFLIDNANAPATGQSTLAVAIADAALAATWWQNPGAPYADSARPRAMWCTFPNGAYDQMNIGAFIQIWCKDGIDGSKVFITASPGTGSSTTITVSYPDATTPVETYPNYTSGAACATAIQASSNYIFAYNISSDAPVTQPATAIGNSYFNGVAQVVAALYPLGVTHFEGPRNEPAAGLQTIQQMRCFRNAVKAGNAAAKVMGPSCVQLSLTISMINLGVGQYCDVIATHNYHTGTQGSISEMRNNLQSLKAAMVAQGIGNMELWMTEGTNGPTVVNSGGGLGTYHPRRAADEIGQLIFFEQFNCPKEQNVPWYGRSHGFWSVPTYHEVGDTSLEPQCILAATLSDEVWGMNYQSPLDFGTIGNQIYYGNIYSNGTTGVAVVVPASYLDNSQVTLAISGSPSSLVLSDGCGNTSTLPVIGGRVTIPLQDRPAYLRLPTGVAVTSVAACLDWGTINLGPSLSPSATTKTLGGSTPPLIGAVSAVADGAWLTAYPNTGIVASGVTINDGVNPPTSDDLILKWSSPQQIGRVIIWCGMVIQLFPGIIKATIDISTDNGTTWTTVGSINKPTPTAALMATATDGQATGYQTYMDEQWIHNCTLGRVYTANALRIHVIETTWGGEATFASYQAGQGTTQRISLQEVGVFALGASDYIAATSTVSASPRFARRVSGAISATSAMSATVSKTRKVITPQTQISATSSVSGAAQSHTNKSITGLVSALSSFSITAIIPKGIGAYGSARYGMGIYGTGETAGQYGVGGYGLGLYGGLTGAYGTGVYGSGRYGSGIGGYSSGSYGAGLYGSGGTEYQLASAGISATSTVSAATNRAPGIVGGQVSATSTVSASRLARSVKISGAVSAQSMVSSSLTASRPIKQGQIFATSIVTGSVSRGAKIFPATIFAMSTTSSSISAARKIAPSTVSATSTVSGSVAKFARVSPSQINATSTTSSIGITALPALHIAGQIFATSTVTSLFIHRANISGTAFATSTVSSRIVSVRAIKPLQISATSALIGQTYRAFVVLPSNINAFCSTSVSPLLFSRQISGGLVAATSGVSALKLAFQFKGNIFATSTVSAHVVGHITILPVLRTGIIARPTGGDIRKSNVGRGNA